jgi:hypothetical protein
MEVVMRYLIKAFFLFATLAGSSTVAQIPSGFRLLEGQGPHGVGIRVAEQYDYSRTFQPLIDETGKPYQGERARPLQTLIWYPAQKSNAEPMRFRDYLALRATQTSYGRLKVLTGTEELIIASMGPSFSDSLWAVRDAGALGEY